MQFASTKTKGKRTNRLAIYGCIPGEVYEFACQNEPGLGRAVRVEDLRLCVGTGDEKHMIGLSNGRSRNSNINDPGGLYIPRPDIQLTMEK